MHIARQVNQWGHIAYGGAGIIVSRGLLAKMNQDGVCAFLSRSSLRNVTAHTATYSQGSTASPGSAPRSAATRWCRIAPRSRWTCRSSARSRSSRRCTSSTSAATARASSSRASSSRRSTTGAAGTRCSRPGPTRASATSARASCSLARRRRPSEETIGGGGTSSRTAR